MTSPLYQGSLSPTTYSLAVSLLNTGLSAPVLAQLSAPLAPASIAFKVMRPDGTRATWQPQASAVQGDNLVATFTFHASVSEIDISGDYLIYATYVVSTGTLRSSVDTLRIYEQSSRREI